MSRRYHVPFAVRGTKIPARIQACSKRPSSAVRAMKTRSFSTLKQICVWKNSAPASIFLPRRIGRKSNGGAKGFSTAPMRKLGGWVSGRPDR